MGIGIGQSQCRQPRKMADGRILANTQANMSILVMSIAGMSVAISWC
jgi:hypothetical protein